MDSEDDFDWEEVPVPEHEQHISITLQPAQKPSSPPKFVS
jgi:xeroderma pigmentosum group C-complementing protein